MQHLLLSATSLAMTSDVVMYAARLVRTMRRSIDLPAGVRVLSILDQVGPLGVTELAQADNCSQPTMSAQVAQLVESGFVTKEPNPTDARGCVITLTEAGRTELDAHRDRISTAVSERLATSKHTPEDLATAVAILREIVETEPGAAPAAGPTATA
ncbi:MarR family winged helix-turn-helix transcriptional regulator [Nocardioides sp. DS6]|uniref:MarR family winged helix-turn-helix transcriptional regulator n=1 Tax=Nocardioides eburneus TaxID=3231482 RepID=A0ABV3T0B2_9ACTN